MCMTDLLRLQTGHDVKDVGGRALIEFLHCLESSLTVKTYLARTVCRFTTWFLDSVCTGHLFAWII